MFRALKKMYNLFSFWRERERESEGAGMNLKIIDLGVEAVVTEVVRLRHGEYGRLGGHSLSRSLALSLLTLSLSL